MENFEKTWEEIKDLFSPPPHINHRREYNGIKVDISNKDTIDIMPEGIDRWLRCNKKEVILSVKELETDNDTFMQIPKQQWIEWFNEPFTD